MTDIVPATKHLAGLIVLLIAALGLPGCQSVDDPAADFQDFFEQTPAQIQLQLDQTDYQPGQAVIGNLHLVNATSQTLRTPLPDHRSVAFYIRTRTAESYGPMKAVEPVFSPHEQTGAVQTVPPGGQLERSFVFTTLTFNRGDFTILAVYEPARGETDNPLKIYSTPVPFSVQGEQALVHRYPDGLLAEEDAIELAAAEFGRPVERTEAQLVIDHAGFNQWWITLWPQAAPAEPAAFLVDPYLARIRMETIPYREQAGKDLPFRPDVQRMIELRDKRKF